MNQIKFTIPVVTPSRNDMDKWHWSERTRQAQMAALEIKIIRVNERLKKATGRRSLFIASYRKRLIDKDNLIGGFKLMIDALTKNELIIDDSPKWLDLLDPVQIVDKKHPRTEMILGEIENEAEQ